MKYTHHLSHKERLLKYLVAMSKQISLDLSNNEHFYDIKLNVEDFNYYFNQLEELNANNETNK